MEMVDMISEVSERWDDLNWSKVIFSDGEEFDVEDFQDFQELLKDTYKLICEIKALIIHEQIQSRMVFRFLSLIQSMTEYSADLFTVSTNRELYSVSRLLTKALLDFSTEGYSSCYGDRMILPDGSGAHIITYSPEEWEEGCLAYDFDEEDYSSFLEYIKSIVLQ